MPESGWKKWFRDKNPEVIETCINRSKIVKGVGENGEICNLSFAFMSNIVNRGN